MCVRGYGHYIIIAERHRNPEDTSIYPWKPIRSRYEYNLTVGLHVRAHLNLNLNLNLNLTIPWGLYVNLAVLSHGTHTNSRCNKMVVVM